MSLKELVESFPLLLVLQKQMDFFFKWLHMLLHQLHNTLVQVFVLVLYKLFIFFPFSTLHDHLISNPDTI